MVSVMFYYSTTAHSNTVAKLHVPYCVFNVHVDVDVCV